MTIYQDGGPGPTNTAAVDVRKKNSLGVLYASGEDGVDNSWRIKINDAGTELSIEHHDPLVDIDFDLTEAHVTTTENNIAYTSDDPYYASVLTDSRTDNTLPAGISGDMAGRVVEWDGFVWKSYPDQWISKVTYSESVHSDRGVFRRMNVIATNPNDLTEHPPQPAAGTVIGSRNTVSDGSGLEILSFKDMNGHFGHLMEFLHGPGDLLNQARSIKLDTTVISFPYELAWVDGTAYVIGDIVVDAGVRFKCNATGTQTTSFATNSSLWTAVDYGNYDAIITDGGAVVVSEGNVVVN